MERVKKQKARGASRKHWQIWALTNKLQLSAERRSLLKALVKPPDGQLQWNWNQQVSKENARNYSDKSKDKNNKNNNYQITTKTMDKITIYNNNNNIYIYIIMYIHLPKYKWATPTATNPKNTSGGGCFRGRLWCTGCLVEISLPPRLGGGVFLAVSTFERCLKKIKVVKQQRSFRRTKKKHQLSGFLGICRDNYLGLGHVLDIFWGVGPCIEPDFVRSGYRWAWKWITESHRATRVEMFKCRMYVTSFGAVICVRVL